MRRFDIIARELPIAVEIGPGHIVRKETNTQDTTLTHRGIVVTCALGLNLTSRRIRSTKHAIKEATFLLRRINHFALRQLRAQGWRRIEHLKWNLGLHVHALNEFGLLVRRRHDVIQ